MEEAGAGEAGEEDGATAENSWKSLQSDGRIDQLSALI